MTSEVLSTETKFTPGTWHASRNFRIVGYSPGIDIGASSGTNIALVHFSHYDQEHSEVIANANLFAASKDLYEALQDLIENPDRLSAHKNARAALLKARGGSSNEGE